jgi:hypothetical protein
LTETALLALQQVAEGFQRPVVGACHRPASAAVVDQGVHRLLKHPLFVAHNDIRRAQLQQALEPVVAVDHPAIQVVQVAGGEAAAVQLNHGPQLGRNDGHYVQHHPFRPIARLAERFDHLQPFDDAQLFLA